MSHRRPRTRPVQCARPTRRGNTAVTNLCHGGRAFRLPTGMQPAQAFSRANTASSSRVTAWPRSIPATPGIHGCGCRRGTPAAVDWCSKLRARDSNQIDPNARCGAALAMRETYCFDELEGGASDPSRAPLERCPRAIAPPRGVVFYPPSGALLDSVLASQRRQQGFAQCCYAWCSLAPPNSGLQRP